MLRLIFLLRLMFLLFLLFLMIIPANSVDMSMHIKAKGVGHKNHDINLNYKHLVFKDFGRGDIVLVKEERELYMKGDLQHKMNLNLVSTAQNETHMWKNTECMKNYKLGAAIHISYKDVLQLESFEYLKTNSTLLHTLNTKFTGKMNMKVEVVDTASKHSAFEVFNTYIGHFEIEREVFVK